jgi:hypothetical protein
MKRFLLLLLFLISSCAPWIQGKGLYQSPNHAFTINIPQDWMRLKANRYLLISRDGPFLQYVLVQERPIYRPFKHTKKKIQNGMLPQEAAEVILDEISSDPAVFNFSLIENIPTTIDGHEGFRIVFKHSNTDGLQFKTIYYGLIIGETFYSIRYNAAERHYFQKELETFQQVLASFAITEAKVAGEAG